jgi:hypothetical protein
MHGFALNVNADLGYLIISFRVAFEVKQYFIKRGTWRRKKKEMKDLKHFNSLKSYS